MPIDLNKITCNHLNLRAAIIRISRSLAFAVVPFAASFFALMSWWGQTRPPLWQPLALLGALTWIGVSLMCAWTGTLWAGLEARDLAALHDMVVEASEDTSDEQDPAARPVNTGRTNYA